MSNDETLILKDAGAPKQQASRLSGKSAFAAGGFVAGAASASAFSAEAAEIIDVTQEGPDSIDTQETIDLECEVKVAQVDDDALFAEAFADARSQVGPGGLFEWNGQIYNTYYKEEWDSMSEAERAEFMREAAEVADFSVDIQDDDVVAQTENVAVELIDEGGDADVEVIVGEIEGMTAAQVSSGDDEIYLVDVDDDGTMDVLLTDMNQDGIIGDNEAIDVSDEGIGLDDICAMQETDVYYASNESMPDYMNSADTAIYQA